MKDVYNYHKNALSVENILQARDAINADITRTPLCACPALSDDVVEVRLKLETLQASGAFKLRGATNAIKKLGAEQLKAGVVCASTGNHGRAVALAASRLGVPSTICMSALVPQNKLDAIKNLGATIKVIGSSQDDAQVEVDRLVAEQGLSEIPPFDHADVVAGQGTIGLELMEDWADLDTVIIPLSGGGLLAGILIAIKSFNTNINVIGVSMERGAAMYRSLQKGAPAEVIEQETLADSLGGGIGLGNQFTFQIVQDLVDDVVLLSEAQIAAGMQFLYREHGLVVEGAAAVGIPVLQNKLSDKIGKKVAVIISGRNVDLQVFEDVMKGNLPY